ncbi:MAG TPA: type VI secretion system baseplate subunit TssE [Polyangiaceae bacterium]|jgi:type VI secretion system protein ImpF|nr:MAG: Anti-adapter protein IraD [Deltaproteobacteria bacterium ADurb.Bin207]HNS97721.1 type VI secretion system baseplate subunit TssE [Polyangiaceae bacterium]HNZ22482.1 type VI secretion system baseplate subunit TssE [Polyangiaceae bacterium]HOD22778.1 type VI secretion system baseplate subunit TssE [Polyangiaceae bacterium]HOE48488.1 type VI secretion system baseplate subunit TssE [Polyangiaceae bacterium]
MAELTYRERLQPSLLDRLTDDQRDQSQESRLDRVISPSRLRECVRRDLVWLFNTTNLSSLKSEINEYPLVAQSTLNYGLPDLAGHTVMSIDVVSIERLLRNAIWSFEPRLIRNSVQVRLDVALDEMTHNAMTFTIEAELWAQPLPLRLYFKTGIDLETGEATVEEVGKGQRG